MWNFWKKRNKRHAHPEEEDKKGITKDNENTIEDRTEMVKKQDVQKEERLKESVPEPEWAVRTKTRGSLSPENKNYIFVHSFSENDEINQLMDRILEFSFGRQLAVFTAEPAGQVFEKFLGDELDAMNIYIPMIDAAYLAATEELSFDSETFFINLQKKGIFVLPVIRSKELLYDFMRLYGEIHGIFLSDQEDMKRLETEIERFIRTDDWAQKALERAFTKQFFFSYRKKDRTFLLKTMRSIHNAAAGSDAAIWFDDFLIPGNDFQNEIRIKMQESDAFLLLVTPQLLEEGNYVITEEYPYARENKQGRILPLEAEKTDRKKLMACCSDLPEIVWFDNEEEINRSLKGLFGDQSSSEDDPEKEYLLGICFLLGIMTEKDPNRSVKFLTSAAERGQIDACRQLFMMYNMGYGVYKNEKEAFQWRKKEYGLIIQSADGNDKEAIEQLYSVLFDSYDGLVVYLASRKEQSEADEITKDFCERIRRLPEEQKDDKLQLWLIEARLLYIDTLRIPDDPSGYNPKADEALEELEQLITELKKLHTDNEMEKNRLHGIVTGLMGEFHGQKGFLDKAEEEQKMACEIFESLLSSAPQNYDLKKLYRSTLGNLGNLQYHYCCIFLERIRVTTYGSEERKQVEQEKCREQSKEYLHKAHDTLGKAYRIAKELTEEEPSTNNLEALVVIIFLYTQTFEDSEFKLAAEYWAEGSRTIDKLEELGNPAYKYSRYKHIFENAANMR